MSEREAAAFESRENFQQIINLRKWDDQAKNTESYPEDLDFYHNLIVEHLIKQWTFDKTMSFDVPIKIW